MEHYLGQLCQPNKLPELKVPTHTTPIDSYYEAIAIVCRGRAFFSTEQRLIGLGHQETLLGDQLCVLDNASTLFLFRQARESPRHVERIMYGGAFKQPLPSDEIYLSDEGATCAATRKQPETAVEEIAHIGYRRAHHLLHMIY